MKRAGNLLERIAERENLRLAFHRAMSGKRDRADVREFQAHLEGNLQRVADRLAALGDDSIGASAAGAFFGYTQFTIHDPKERLITAPSFADRVLHHAILNVCEPVFERYLIDDTFACRRGKGRVAALQRAVHFSAQNAVALKFDIRKYFDSISHEVLLGRLERRFKDRRLLDLFRQIVGGYHTRSGCGLPIGALTSQHFANFYLASLDRFVKETLRARGYARYMDDCIVWGATGKMLRGMLEQIRQFLSDQLRLQIKPAPEIRPTRHGIEFLGCRVYPTHLKLNRRSRNRFRARLRDLERAHQAGLIDDSALQIRGTALAAFTTAGGVKSWRFRTRVLAGHLKTRP